MDFRSIVTELHNTAAYYEPILVCLGVIGPIVGALLMRFGKAKHYWPWALMLAIAVAAFWGPRIFYRWDSVSSGGSNSPTPPLSDNSKFELLAGPIAQGANIERLIDSVRTTCKVKVTAANGENNNLALRNIVAGFFQFPDGRCQLVDDDKDRNPDSYTLSIPTTTPHSEMVYVHFAAEMQPVGETIRHAIGAMGLKVRPNYVLPNNVPPSVVWIELGTGSVWQ